jgi:soluble P-type ATPase
MEKQFIKSSIENELIVRIFQKNYNNTIEHINSLIKEAKIDFPHLKDKNIKVVVLSGERYNRITAIEFVVARKEVPDNYFEWTRADDLGFCKTYN